MTTRALSLTVAVFGFALALLAEGALAAQADSARPALGSKSALAALPEAPERALVLNHCAVCHDIDWITRSGGTKEGWTDRIERMIRAGATIPKDQIPMVAAYLAKAFPPRARPQGHE